MKNKYIVVFDVETTGKNPKVDHIKHLCERYVCY